VVSLVFIDISRRLFTFAVQLLDAPDGVIRATVPSGHDDLVTLEQCSAAAHALIGVLSDVLDLTKMDAQGVRLLLGRPHSLARVIKGVVSQMALMAAGHGVTLVVRSMPSPHGVALFAADAFLIFDQLHISQIVAK
jgi:signal transduction histidine kinase